MVKAVFLDFYGTVVLEDGEIVREITQTIAATGRNAEPRRIGAVWWEVFQTLTGNSFGATFETQRELEYKSMAETLREFESDADAVKLCERMFARWEKPPIFEEAKSFLEQCPVPVFIVSNIDRADLLRAMNYHQLEFAGIFTSEDAKSYKPRRELFELALRSVGMDCRDVVHIGDSLNSDVKGASALGIGTIWVNRTGKTIPEGVCAVKNLLEVFDTDYFK